MTRDQRLSFEQYWNERVQRADAITPGEQLALIALLERELVEQGRVPLPSGPARVPVEHPIVAAALEGRPVSVGGKAVGTPTSVGERMQALPTPAKLALLALIGLLPVLFALLAVRGGRSQPPVIAGVAETPMPTVTATMAPTGEPTPSPTAAPTEALPTATPYSIALVTGAAPPGSHDPASLEIAGYSYILATGTVQNGIWEPSSAEWLEGTTLRRVVAIPYEPEVANTVMALRPGTVVRLRLRSGEIVKYRVAAVERQQRQQIEVLAARDPSLVVVLAGEPGPERWVVTATAIQEAQTFTESAALDPNPIDGSDALTSTTGPISAAPLPLESTTTITSTRAITNTEAGLELTVDTCERVTRIGDQEPPDNDQGFLLCEVTLRALEDNTETVTYSGQHLAITEQRWMAQLADWWPPPVSVSRALRSGTLSPGGTTTGRVAGLVSNDDGALLRRSESQPVLVWDQAGMQYQIMLEADAP